MKTDLPLTRLEMKSGWASIGASQQFMDHINCMDAWRIKRNTRRRIVWLRKLNNRKKR